MGVRLSYHVGMVLVVRDVQTVIFMGTGILRPMCPTCQKALSGNYLRVPWARFRVSLEKASV